MPVAELYDGTELEFEDGTDQAVIDRVVREQTRARIAREPAVADAAAGSGAQAPAPTARRGALRAVAPYQAPADAERGTPATEARRVDQALAAANDGGVSVLDQSPGIDPGRSRADPLLQQDFVDRVRAEFAAVPEAQRLPALQALAKGADARARAARAILGDVGIENERAAALEREQPQMVSALSKVPAPTGKGVGALPRFPDYEPTLAETASSMPAPEIAASRRGAAALQGQDALAKMADDAAVLARDFDAEAFAKAHPFTASVASGGGHMLGGLINSVPMLLDFAGKMFGVQSRAPDSETGLDILKTADSLMPALGKQTMAEAQDKGEFAPWLVLNIGQQAPQIVAPLLAAIYPPLAATILPAMGLQTAGQSFAAGDSSLGAGLKGLAEVAGESMPLAYFHRAQHALAKLPTPLQGEFLAALGKSLPARAGAVTGQMLVESIEEGATQIMQNGIDKVVEGKRKGLLDDLAESMVVGAFAAGPMAVPHAVAGIAPQSRAGALAQAFAADVADTTYSATAVDAAARAALDPGRAQIVRVEDMPTTPFTPAQVAAAVAAAPQPTTAAGVITAPAATPDAQSAAAAMAAGAEGGDAGGRAGPAAPEPREVGGGAAPAPAIATAPQGSLADAAQRLLKERADGQPGVDADLAPGRPATPGSDDGRGTGAVDRVAPAPAPAPAPDTAAPAAGRGKAGLPAGAEGLADAVDVPLTADAFKTAGQALAFAAENRLTKAVRVVEAKGGGFVLAPTALAKTTATKAEDQVNAEVLNAEIERLGWTRPDGAAVVIEPVDDAKLPPAFRRIQDVARAAFGIRIQAAKGVPGLGLQFGTRAYVNADKVNEPDLATAVAGHEAFHWLETNDAAAAKAMYDGLEEWLLPDAVDRQHAFENRALGSGEERVSKAGAKSEVVANINGAMWIDPEFWGRLYELDNGSTFRKVLYQFMRAAAKVARVFAGTTMDVRGFVSDVGKVREVAAGVWAERARSTDQKKAKVSQKPKGKAPERIAGETTKAYAKRVIDVRPAPATLPEDQDAYFTDPEGAVEVPVSALLLAKPRRDTDRTGENASKRMAAAAAGELEKRPPIEVIERGDKYEVVDGNSTVAAARRNGWKKLRVVVVEPERQPPTDWTQFSRASGTLGIPRHEMPQVRGPDLEDLIEFMRGRGIDSSRVVVAAADLKPVQAEYSPAKVAAVRKDLATKVMNDVSLISADDHVIDGHHRWLAKAEAGLNVNAIRFNASARDVIDAMWEFEHVDVDAESEPIPAAVVADAAYETKIEAAAIMARSEIPETIVEGVVNLLKRVPPVTRRNDVDAVSRIRLETMLRPVIERGMAANAAFERLLADVAASIDADYVIAPVKTLDRAVDKMFEDELILGERAGPESLKDVIRGSIIVDTIDQARHAIETVEAAMDVVPGRVKNRIDSPLKTGYRDVLINVRLDNGLVAEVQIHVRPMIMVKDLGSMLYAVERVLPKGARRTQLMRAQRQLYGAAWTEALRGSSASNSASVAAAPSRMTRPGETSAPVMADTAELPSAERTTGMPSRSTNLEPTGRALQSNALPMLRLKRVEEIGGYQIRETADGGLSVFGDQARIRSLLPDDFKGRLFPGGVVFTALNAPRVRAILAGDKNTRSRAGVVVSNRRYTSGERRGQYVGAPEIYNTPAKIPALRRLLMQMAREGEPGRFWYENSGRAVLEMTGYDKDEARKFVALLAIYSPQAKVDANTTFALRAWAQYKAGLPISVKTKDLDGKANAVLYEGRQWEGEKTSNFFRNLMREIDAAGEGAAAKQGVTVDMWMMRAAGYDTDAPGAAAYAFVENETARLARELGWEPQQVQAAIWVGMKARLENAGVKKKTVAESIAAGYSKMVPGKAGKMVLRVLDESRHRRLWLDNALALKLSEEDTAGAKFDFADGIDRHMGQVSWEARPGRSTGILPGIHDAAYELQAEFQQAVADVLTGADGDDLLSRKLGILFGGRALAPGVWQSEAAAGMQSFVAMAPVGGKDEAGAVRKGTDKFSVDPAQARVLDTYSAILGLLLHQEGVGWHRPFYAANKGDHNGVELRIGRPMTPAEALSLHAAIDAAMKARGASDWEQGVGLISSAEGMRVVNFGAVDDNGAFRKLVAAAAAKLPQGLVIEPVSFAASGNLVTNDWKADPNGEGYRRAISDSGRSDVLGWAESVLGPRIQTVFEDFSARYGWGNPGKPRVTVTIPVAVADAGVVAQVKVDADAYLSDLRRRLDAVAAAEACA